MRAAGRGARGRRARAARRSFRRTAGGGVATVLTCLAALGSAPAELRAQSAVRSARLATELAEDGSARVRIEYELEAEGDVGAVPVVVLVPRGVEPRGVTGPRGDAVALVPEGGLRRSASIRPPDADRARTLSFEYRVEGAISDEAGGFVARIPVLTVALPADGESGEVFSGAVSVPEGWAVSEAFPAGLREGAPGVFEATLPVIPSLLTLRGRTDGRWRPGAGLVVELLTALVLTGLGVVTWRRVRETGA